MSTHKLYRDLAAGEVFHSPRREEGWVKVVCPPGTCTHDERDRYSTHVRALDTGNEFFVLADPGTDTWEGDTVEVYGN